MRAHWQTPTRHYSVELRQDLFGTWVLTRAWGSRSSRRGSGSTTPAADQEAGRAMVAAEARRRTQRGYRLVAIES